MYCQKCGAEMPDGSKVCPKCGMNQTTSQVKVKKPFYKRWWFWTLAIILAFGIFGKESNDTQNAVPQSQETSTEVLPVIAPTPKPVPSPSPSEEPSPKPSKKSDRMTSEEFAAIESGMTYGEVVELVGGDGELISESDIGAGSKYVTQIYSWKGNGGLGSNANVTFQGGVVVSKAQIGLE